MIRLFGAVHGGLELSIFSQVKGEIKLKPTSELEQEIKKFPKGTIIGLEDLNIWDNAEVNEHSKNIGQEFDITATRTVQKYFEEIMYICARQGHKVIYLEDKNIWFKYSEALLKKALIKREWESLCQKEGESDLDYDKKFYELKEKEHRAEIDCEKIFLLERDDAILKNIAKENVNVVFTGLGHADFWMLNQDFIKEKYGIEFGEYSSEIILDPRVYKLTLIEKAIPNKDEAYYFTSIKKSIKFFEKGRLLDEDPDFIGTWDTVDPSRGYFEVFVDERKDEGIVKGIIEDLIGTATFEGKMVDGNFVEFTKVYTESTTNAIKKPLKYEIVYVENNKSLGYFNDDYFRRAFFMEKYDKNNKKRPVDLSLSWEELSPNLKIDD